RGRDPQRAVRLERLGRRAAAAPGSSRPPGRGPRPGVPVRAQPDGRARVRVLPRTRARRRTDLAWRAVFPASGRGYIGPPKRRTPRSFPLMPMRPSLKALRSRVAESARDAAQGGVVPAGQEPAQVRHPGRPCAVERGTMRRRLRRALRLCEALLTELGALEMEMHRQGRHNPALVERKAREALTVDREAIGLARALGIELTVGEVVAAGIAGTCPACGGLLATDDRFCAHCGTPATARNGGQGAQARED